MTYVQTSFYIYWIIWFGIWVNGVLLCTFCTFLDPLVSADLYMSLTMVHLVLRCPWELPRALRCGWKQFVSPYDYSHGLLPF